MKTTTNPNKGNKLSDITTKHLSVYSSHQKASHYHSLPLQLNCIKNEGTPS